MGKARRRKVEAVRYRHGISSFTPGEFGLLKMVAKDSATLDATYEDWRKNVDNVKQILIDKGPEVIEVNLTVAEIEAYCLEKGLENIGATRAQLVQEKLSRKPREGHTS